MTQNLLVPMVIQVRGEGHCVFVVHRRKQKRLVPWVMQVNVKLPMLGHCELVVHVFEQND